MELAREAACLAPPKHALLHLRLGLLQHVGHILRCQWPPLRFSDPESTAVLAHHRVLPVLAALVEARAEPVDLRAVLRLYVRRRQQLILVLVDGGDCVALASNPELLLQRLLLVGVLAEQVRLRVCLLLLQIHGQVLVAVGILRETMGHALAQWLGRVERLVVHLHHCLLCREVGLMVLLGLDRPVHVELAAVLTQVGAAHELLVEPLRAHVLLDAVDDLNDVFDILFELLANL